MMALVVEASVGACRGVSFCQEIPKFAFAGLFNI